MEDSRTEHGVLTLRVREQASAAGAARAAVHIHHVVKRGAVMKVMMDAWRAIHPDLLVMGTHGRSGLSRLLFGGYAEAALLGCPSDILVVRAPDERAGPA